MTSPSRTHLVLIPSYNSGGLLEVTVRRALENWSPVWVVIDGSSDGSGKPVIELAEQQPARLRVVVSTVNRGKGAAVLEGVRLAREAGFSHALTLDADNQHDAESIAGFMALSRTNPRAMILGEPVFDQSAPAIRVRGRKISNWWVNLETLWWGVNDSLYGMRLYPVEPLIETMESTIWARRFDFDAEAVVRLCWKGLPVINQPTAVRYVSREQGGVSHFRYLRDNALLTWMHFRLLIGALVRLPVLLARKRACLQ